jgi:uncharacterized repeat protein (TIGR01451 family)
VTHAEALAGQVVNTASTTSDQIPGPTPSNTVTTPVGTPAALSVVKALTSESGTVAGVAEPGESLTYTVTVNNSGGTPFTDFDFDENVPLGATLTSVTGAGVTACATPSPGPATCVVEIASVPAGGSIVATVVFVVDNPIPAGVTEIANTVSGGDVPPGCASPNVCSVTTPTPSDLTVVKTLSAESGSVAGVAEPGETLTYTVTLANGGGTAFTSFDFVENVPAGVSLTAISGAGVTACATPVPGPTACNVTVASIPAGGNTTVTVVFTVADPIPVGVLDVVNTVSGGDVPPGCPAPNDCSVTTPTAPAITVLKTVDSLQSTGPGTYRANYRIEVTSTGGAGGVYTLSDTMSFPATGVQFNGNAQVQTTGGSINPALPGGAFAPVNGAPVQLSASGVPIASGATHVYLLAVPVRVDDTLVAATCDGTPGNGLFNAAALSGDSTAQSDACTSLTPATGGLAIRLSKTVELGFDNDGDRYGDVGDVLSYALRITNLGTLPLDATSLVDMQVTDLECDTTTVGGVPIAVYLNEQIFASSFDPGDASVLPVGDSVLCWATHTLTAADVAARRVTNTATASGQGVSGDVVSSTATAVFGAFQ